MDATYEKRIPVVEMFGPVLQGEGGLVGRPTWFLRTGACDYTCLYCDSMHAVDAKEIEARKRLMTCREIATALLDREKGMKHCRLLTLSGGNPAVWDLHDLVRALHDNGYYAAIETQGTIYKPWIAACDYITISPKGPGMLGVDAAEEGKGKLFDFLTQLTKQRTSWNGICVKIPVFDSADLEYVQSIRQILRRMGLGYIMYISVGNPSVPMPAPHGTLQMPAVEEHRRLILDRYEKISNLVMSQFPALWDVSILPQMHVIQYGNEHGR